MVLTSNAQDDDRFSDALSIKEYGLRSVMCAPLVDDDGTVTIMWQKDDDGLLCMSSTSAGSPFDITRAQINSS